MVVIGEWLLIFTIVVTINGDRHLYSGQEEFYPPAAYSHCEAARAALIESFAHNPTARVTAQCIR